MLYGKPGCSLCAKVREILIQLQAEKPFHLQEIDINTDPDARQIYKDWIPVVFLDGREVMRGLPNELALRGALGLQL